MGERLLVCGDSSSRDQFLSTGLIEARNESMRRLEKQADQVGADAVINLRFVTSQVMTGAAELLAYGTAVKLSGGAG